MFRRLVVAFCAIMAAGALISADAHRLRSRGGGENLVVIAEHDRGFKRQARRRGAECDNIIHGHGSAPEPECRLRCADDGEA